MKMQPQSIPDNQRLMPWLLASILILLLALASSAIWILDQFQRDARENALAQLRLNVDTLRHEISSVWLPQHLNTLRVWSADFVSISPAETQRHLSQLTETGAYQDYWLLDAASGLVRFSARKNAVGRQSPFLDRQRHSAAFSAIYAAKMKALAAGNEQALLLGPEPGQPNSIRILLMLPLGKPGQPPTAYLQVLVRNPASLLDSPIRYRLGKSGETYLVDAEAYLISDSRFIKSTMAGQISRLRAVMPGAKAEDGAAAMTLAANLAIKSRGNGSSAEAYADYRGVPVLGAWAWNDALDLAVISEIDVAEVMAANQARRQQIWMIVIGIGVLLLAVLVTLHRLWRRNLMDLVDFHAVLIPACSSRYAARMCCWWKTPRSIRKSC